MNLNKAFILGNVTRDPDVRSLPSGQQVASFSIATNRFYTDGGGQKKQEAEFHNIVCFGKLADIVSRYITKGALMLIEGRIKTRNWQNQQGVKQYRTEIVSETVQLGPGMQGQSGGMPQRPAQGMQQNSPAAPEEIPVIEENAPVNFASEEPKVDTSNPDEIDVKDIPF